MFFRKKLENVFSILFEFLFLKMMQIDGQMTQNGHQTWQKMKPYLFFEGRLKKQLLCGPIILTVPDQSGALFLTAFKHKGVVRLINPPFPKGPRGGQRVMVFITPSTIYIKNAPDLASPGV